MTDYRVVFVEAYPRVRGSQRSLALLLANLPPQVHASVLCVATTQAADFYRRTGKEITLELPPPALRGFGGGLLAPSKLRIATLVVAALFPYTLRLRRRLRELAPDILHCNQARAVLLAGLAALSLGIPVVWHLRGANPLRGLLGKAADRLSQRVICVSRSLVDGVLTRSKARVVANGIDVSVQPAREDVEAAREAISQARRERGLNPGPTLITASSLIPYKGHHHLADALSRVIGTAPECDNVLWVALGEPDTPVSRRYWADVESRFLSGKPLARHLFVAGWKTEPLAWLAAADITVLPTVETETYRFSDGESIEVIGSEGLPRTILESMAVGTPVIASRVAGVTDQLEDGISGRIVPPSDPAGLATAIIELAENAAARRALAEGASKRLGLFSVDSMVAGTVAVHRELLRSSDGEVESC